MARFYFEVFAGNQATYAYYVEAPDQATADASIVAYSGVRRWESIKSEDIPADMTFKPSEKAPGVWEGKRGPRPTDPRDPSAKRNP